MYVIVTLAYVVCILRCEDKKVMKKENKMKKIFRKEHIWQPVYSDKFGTGIIVRVDESGVCPVKVRHATVSSIAVYTQDGRYSPAEPPVLSFGTSHCYGEPSYPVKYTRVGEVSATPMTRKEYNMYRGWELLDNESGEDEGYLLKYSVDKNYVQWQPKKIFHKLHLMAI